MIHIPAHTVLRWLHHLVIHGGACPAQCPDASSVLPFFVCVCYSSTQYPQKTFSLLSTLTFSHQSPCTLLVMPHVGHIAQLHRSPATSEAQLGKHCPRDPGTKDATSSPSVPTPTGDPAAEEWSPWSVCSTTCGEGWQTRTRFCVSSSYSTQCSGPLREQRQCNNSAVCPGGLSTPCTHGQEGKGDAQRLTACNISIVIFTWREMVFISSPFPFYPKASYRDPC